MGAPYASPGNRGAIGRVPADVHPVEANATETDLPDPERVSGRDHGIGAAATLVVVAAWVALAAWRPDVTYHLAPVFAGAAWPVALRRGAPLRVAPTDTALGAAAGTLLATLAAVVLWRVGWLDGPTLWDDGPAIVETLPAIVAGALGGYRCTRCGPVV